MGFWRRATEKDDHVVLGEPLPIPVATVDGWSLTGTELAGIKGDDARELATLLHGIALGMETPWIYERCAQLLEESGFSRMALTALDAWLSHPLAQERPENTRLIERQRYKLQARLVREGSVGNSA